MSPSRCPPWQPERPGPTRREPRRAQRSYTTRRDTIQSRRRAPLESGVTVRHRSNLRCADWSTFAHDLADSKTVTLGIGTRCRDSVDSSPTRTHAPSRAEIESSRARVPQYSPTRTFSCDIAAQGCASLEATTLPGSLRRWTTYFLTPRATTVPGEPVHPSRVALQPLANVETVPDHPKFLGVGPECEVASA